MQSQRAKKYAMATMLISGVILGGWFWFSQTPEPAQPGKGGKQVRPAPVEVVALSRGPITRRRVFNGTLEARAEFMVAPKVGGRIERLAVNLADPVERGQVVAQLDDAEFVQAVALARAELAVTQANLAEAKSGAARANRDFQRMTTLNQRGVASESQYDEAVADQAAMQARLEVASAQVSRAQALLETANIRLGYTKVTADWTSGEGRRLVAERLVDEGHTVSANSPLLRIVELDPITGIIHVTEKDYAWLRPGQTARLTTDAFPGEEFVGRLDRISPVFRQATRQARVELTIDNHQLRLKPGMFIRATVELEQLAEAIIVPVQALASRGDQTGVFVVDPARMIVSWRPVRVGIQEGERVQIEGPGLGGRVVTLGHQLIDDGSPIFIPADAPQDSSRHD